MAVLNQAKLEVIRQAELQMARDDGDRYREELGKVIMEMDDAYRKQGNPFRSHLGASLLGRKCSRELWYSFRWFTRTKHSPRLMRLFNRGHLEEARFIAFLRQVEGVQVVCAHPETGKQFRISFANGHGGGSLDSLIYNLPDLPGEWVLGEYKTHNEKSFKKLVKEGVQKAKPEHYTQMQIYGAKYGLNWALYLAVCKNDDAIHGELVRVQPHVMDQYIVRGEKIIATDTPPPRISANPTWYECKFCDQHGVCHDGHEPAMNCRTCIHSSPIENKEWWCHKHSIYIKEDLMITGCATWDPNWKD